MPSSICPQLNDVVKEHGNTNEITIEQAPRFLDQAKDPFGAAFPHPAWGPFHISRDEVEDSTSCPMLVDISSMVVLPCFMPTNNRSETWDALLALMP